MKRIPNLHSRGLLLLAALAIAHYGCGGGSDSTGPDTDAISVSLTAPCFGLERPCR
jgi:hypothetical protein